MSQSDPSAATKRGQVKIGAVVTVPVEHDVSKHLQSVLDQFLNSFSIYVHELYPDAFITSEVTVDDVAARETRAVDRSSAAQDRSSDPFAKGGDRHWLWWADASYLRPGLYLRHRRILRVSMWLLRPRYSWNVRGYGRRWT